MVELACVRVLIFLLNREGAKGAKEERKEGSLATDYVTDLTDGKKKE